MVARDGVTSPGTPLSPAREETEGTRDAHEQELELASPEAPRRAARTWFKTRTLDVVLARLEPTAVARLHEMLLGDAMDGVEVSPALLAIVERAAATLARPVETPLERVTSRIALAAAVLDASPQVPAAQLRAAIDRIIPLDAALAAGVARSGREVASDVATPPVQIGELTVRSALPFLLLSALGHAGWLDAAAALLALHGREADAIALAAGLAAKVLGPLERGWARSPADRLAIAAFAGCVEPLADVDVAGAAAASSPSAAHWITACARCSRARVVRGRSCSGATTAAGR